MGIFDDIDQNRRYVSRIVIDEIMREEEAKQKANKVSPYNKEIFDNGILWYTEGLKLEDAPESLRANSNFVRGFELALRRDMIRKTSEIHGAEWFFSGKSLEEAPESYLKNENFVNGYINAMNDKKLGRK